MTLLRIFSDIHLEFADFRPKADLGEDLVVLAGDIGEATRGVEWAKEVFAKPILYVPGNHEYYEAGRMADLEVRFEKHVDEKFMVLCAGRVYGGDDDAPKFVGGTLWTDFRLFGDGMELQCRGMAGNMMNDFRLITYGPNDTFGPNKLTPARAAMLHRQFLEGISDAAGGSHDVVVVTHHAPSIQSVDPSRYSRMDMLNAAYASNLEQFILDRPKIKLWIHGHMHNKVDYMIGQCRVVANPRGYLNHPKHYNDEFIEEGLMIEV